MGNTHTYTYVYILFIFSQSLFHFWFSLFANDPVGGIVGFFKQMSAGCWRPARPPAAAEAAESGLINVQGETWLQNPRVLYCIRANIQRRDVTSDIVSFPFDGTKCGYLYS